MSCLNSEQDRQAVEARFKICLSTKLFRPPCLPLECFVTQLNVRHDEYTTLSSACLT